MKNDKKPILIWLKQMPPTLEAQALNNFRNTGLDNEYIEVDNMFDAIWFAFVWRNTNEGFPYWERIASKYLVNKE